MHEWPQDVAKAERRKNESGPLPVHITTDSPAENMPQLDADIIIIRMDAGRHLNCSNSST